MQKETLLLLHGALGSKEQFALLTPLLEGCFDVHTIDFEGHGDRSTARSFSIDVFVENTLSYLKQHNISTCILLGYSMGGYVGLRLAQQYPSVFRRIFTLGTKFDWSPETAAREVKQLNPQLIKEKVPKFAALLAERHPAIGWEKMLEETAGLMQALGAKPLLNEETLAAINCPVHCLLGAKDKMVSIAETKQVVDWLPSADFQLLENTGHPIEKVDAAKLVALVLEKIVGASV